MSEGPKYPIPVSGKIAAQTKSMMEASIGRTGVTEGALVRMALESFLPGYLAAQGRPQNVEFLAKVVEAIEAKPELKADIEKLTRTALRQNRKAA